jgi:hypothetical protein
MDENPTKTRLQSVQEKFFLPGGRDLAEWGRSHRSPVATKVMNGHECHPEGHEGQPRTDKKHPGDEYP